MTTVMIVHSACGSRVYISSTFMIAWLVFTITNNLIHIVSSSKYYLISKLSITVVGCMMVCTFLIARSVITTAFTITNNLIKIVSYYEYYLIFKLSITVSLYGSTVNLDICIYDYSHNIRFYHRAIL